MANVKKIAKGTVKDAEKALPKLTDAEVAELREIEEAGDKRVTLLAAIDDEIDSRKGDGPENPKAYARGREAYRAGIKREDSPYLDADRDDWLAGWDFQKKS